MRIGDDTLRMILRGRCVVLHRECECGVRLENNTATTRINSGAQVE